MSYIPAVRNEFDEKGNKNAYWEGQLDNVDKNYIAGYDSAVERIKEEFMGVWPMDIDHVNVNTEVVADVADGKELTDGEEKSLNPETLAVLGVREKLIEALELYRNDIVVSMLENLDKYPVSSSEKEQGS